MKRFASAAAAALILAWAPAAATLAAPATDTSPTCADLLGIAVHGQHVVGDYVAGIPHDDLEWPPKGAIGSEVSGNGGAAVPGGPGPGFHFVEVYPPGASFCIEAARSGGRR